MPSSRRTKPSALGRRLPILIVLCAFGTIECQAAEQPCSDAALAGAQNVRAEFERDRGVRMDKSAFEDVAKQIVSEACARTAPADSKARVAAAGDATRRYLENILARGRSTAPQALVADAMGARKGLGRMDRRSFGVLKVECTPYPAGMVSIGDAEIAQCGRRMLIRSGESQVSVSSAGTRVCSGKVSLAVQQERSCTCGQGNAAPAGAPAFQPITCS